MKLRRAISPCLIAFFLLVMRSAEPDARAAPVAQSPTPRTFSTTTVAKLLSEEARLHNMSPSVSTLAQQAIAVATQAARGVGAKPQDRDTAIRALKAINAALSGQNFLQPPREELWVHTLGEALTPHTIDDPNVKEGLQDSENSARLPFINRSQPVYWVDCDMGSLFFIAVGERLGWDIRLAAVPHHNYVRWHLSPSIIVNWDWTASASLSDVDYRERVSSAEHWIAAGVFAVSLPHATMQGYYLGQIGAKFDRQAAGVALLERGIHLAPNEPSTANNMAWAYGTTPNTGEANRRAAITYALQAWATDPDNANYKDTVACVLSANAHYDIAEALEREAVQGGHFQKQQEGFGRDLEALTHKTLCPHGD